MSYVDISKYRTNEPYPEVNILHENRFFVTLLQDDYAGTVSEYTSISQFIYAYIISDEEELSDDFYGIAMVEMTHLDLIADVIQQLGGNPVFRSGNGMVWNSNVLAYGNSTKNRLRLCLKIKQRSLDQYKSHLNRINDPNIKDLLQRIILDEELHIKILRRHLDKFKIKHDNKQNEDDYDSRRTNDRYNNKYDEKYDSYDNNADNSYTSNVNKNHRNSNDINNDYSYDKNNDYDNSQDISQSSVPDSSMNTDTDDSFKYDDIRNSRHRRGSRRRNRHDDVF